MNLDIILGVLGLVALLISTGIITVGASSYINAVASKVFERNGEPSPVGKDYTYKGAQVETLQTDLRDFPTMLQKWYLICHGPAFALILFIISYDAASGNKISSWYLYIGNFHPIFRHFLGALPTLTVFLILGYIGFVIWHLLKFKRSWFIIVGSRFSDN